MGNDHPSSTWSGRKLVDLCKASYPWVCHLCGQPIPRGMPAGHPLSYEADHVRTSTDHPHLRWQLSNLRPSHKWCNQIRGSRPLTTGLLAEITVRFAARFITRPRPALGFFDIEIHAAEIGQPDGRGAARRRATPDRPAGPPADDNSP